MRGVLSGISSAAVTCAACALPAAAHEIAVRTITPFRRSISRRLRHPGQADRPSKAVAKPWTRTASVRSNQPATGPRDIKPGASSDEAAALQPTAASAVRISGTEVNAVPFLRPGEALEVVPGLIVTQHSGEGKANQYFLRGFNLDHGTDLSIKVDDMPVNMPTHGHGQGYADINFLIPELIQSLYVRKGPCYADAGDFSSAGSVEIDYLNKLPKNMAELTVGSSVTGAGWPSVQPR